MTEWVLQTFKLRQRHVDQHILELDVPMHDPLGMQVSYCANYLGEDPLYHAWREDISLLTRQLEEIAPWTVIKDQ